MCGTLEVALKAYLHPRHHHCTDEAQDTDASQVSVTDMLLLLFQIMPFPKSVVLHFPAEIHRTQGVSEVAPQLLQTLDVQKIAAVQFLRNGRVRVTTKTSDYQDEFLEGSLFLFGDVPIPVTAADQPLRSVFVRDLPVEVPDADVKSVFESFGCHPFHPSLFFSQVPVCCQWYPSFCNVIPWFHSVVCVHV